MRIARFAYLACSPVLLACADERIDLGGSPDATGTGVPFHDVLTVDSDTLAATEDAGADAADGAASEVGPEVLAPFDPVLTALEGSEVLPQTALHLGATVAEGDGIISIEWRVSQPIGSVSTFKPSATALAPTFEVNVAGVYRFEARMRNARGVGAERSFMVFVLPADGIHIELLWDTPGDTDPSDEGPAAGSDLDLHFAHPLAAPDDGLGPDELDLDGDGREDPWFDNQFDCFWFNPHPNWGAVDPSIDDDPSLDRDDTDSAGPENLNFAAPENGTCYRVGVHSWSENGMGRSLATVRIYIAADLHFEQSGVPLDTHDFWEVAEICWGASELVKQTKVCATSRLPCTSSVSCGTGESCDLFITKDYVHPSFPSD